MQEQAHLIGLETVTGRTLRLQGQLVVFALVFHLTTGTGDVPIEPLGAGLLHVRHDKARADTLCGHLDLYDHAARALPCARLGAGRVTACGFSPTAR